MKYTEEEIVFLKENYEKKGGTFCAEKLNREIKGVRAKANSLNLKRVRNFQPIKLDQFINIGKPEVAYLLGFLWADGYVSKRSVTCLISTEDFNDLSKSINKIGEWYLHEVKPKEGEKHRTIFGRYDSAITKVFLDYDYQNKSKVISDKVLRAIPEEIRHYFWRGFFDGDGNINKSGHYRASISGPIDFDWTELEKQFNKLGIYYTILKIKAPFGDTYHCSSRFQVSDKENFQKFLFYIYKNRESDGIGLERKYQSFLKRLKEINKPKIAAYDLEGNLLGEFKSAPEMAEKMNMKVCTINCALSKRNGVTKKIIIKKLT